MVKMVHGVKDFAKILIDKSNNGTVSVMDIVDYKKAHAEIESANKRAAMWHREAELNAAELIKMQAEIEKLKEASEEAVSCFHRMESLYNIKCMELKVAKAETIKDFAEKANKMITDIYNKHIFGCNDLNDEEKDAIINFSDDITGGFDNLVKEMLVMRNEKNRSEM